ncbi:hypothetical protein KFE25_003390 [Diacronema lutheri]|uniref:Mitochondrial ATPase complex subunit ATP10 n=2 Tax=Diacronema lutheri TaxID=2081491 RepID=A0A8J5XMA0_DIALT|nr:hypothetical protein KFE25_003390 [Diacronema lutheri]
MVLVARAPKRAFAKMSEAYAAWVARSEQKWAASRAKLVEDFNDHSARFREIGQTIREEGMETGLPSELIPRDGRFAAPSTPGVIDLVTPEPRDFSPSGIFKGRITLLGVSASAHGREFVSKIVEPIIEDGGVDTGARQVVELSLIDNGPLTWLVKPILLPSVRAAIPAERRRHFLCLFGDSLAVRNALRVHNRFAGFVYIVDRTGMVAWHAAGHRKTSVSETDVGLVRRLLEEAASEKRAK